MRYFGYRTYSSSGLKHRLRGQILYLCWDEDKHMGTWFQVASNEVAYHSQCQLDPLLRRFPMLTEIDDPTLPEYMRVDEGL